MRFLITGGSGFIGSNLVRFLLSQPQFSVCNLDRLTYAAQQNSLIDLQDHPSYQFRQLDLNDPALPFHVDDFQPDLIIHLAAESHVDRSIDAPAPFLHSNVLGTYHLLDASLRYWHQNPQKPFRLLHVSTDEVFGSLTPHAPKFDPSSRYDPHSPYAASKAAADHLVRAWHSTYGLPTLIVNASNNYGPYQFPEKLIPTVILRALQQQSIPIYGDGTNIRDWMHVDDHCRALLAVALHGTVGETYTLGADNEQSNLDVVHQVCLELDRLQNRSPGSNAQQIEFVPDRPGHDLRYAVNATKIRTELGWTPLIPFDFGLRETVRWYFEHRLWWQRILDEGTTLNRQGLRIPHPTS